MKEIEFRGMDIHGEWHYGLLTCLKGDIGTVKKGVYISNSIGSPFAYQVRAETIGQYLYRKDKNNKKIFEGDIIKVVWSDSDGNTKEMLRDIKWTKRGYDNIFNLASYAIEVIGDIYGNLDLLKD